MIYVYRIPPGPNTGDNATIPSRYFDLGPHREVNYKHDCPVGAKVVFSGGGMFGQGPENRMKLIARRAARVVLWSAGVNYRFAGPHSRIADWTSADNILAGVRDAGMGLPWLPCVSCMHGALDDPPQPAHREVVYHGKQRIAEHGRPAAACDEGLTITEAVAFLASGETVVTSSYHGMYWATLLGRRVIAIPSHENAKFYHWPFSHVRLRPDVDWRSVDAPPPCIGVLEHCREANRRFYQRVKRFVSE